MALNRSCKQESNRIEKPDENKYKGASSIKLN